MDPFARLTPDSEFPPTGKMTLPTFSSVIPAGGSDLGIGENPRPLTMKLAVLSRRFVAQSVSSSLPPLLPSAQD